jgi:hypothetical protein
MKKSLLVITALLILLPSGVQVTGNSGATFGVQRASAASAPAYAKIKAVGGKMQFKGGTFKFSYTRNTAPVTNYVENLFSAYTYTNTGDLLNDVTVTTGVDLQNKGGLIWGKNRNGTARHSLIDTVKGVASQLDTASALGADNTNDLTSIGTTGFVVKNVNAAVDTRLNGNTGTYVYWSFAQAPKFFKTVTQVHVNGVANTIDLSTLGTVGMVAVTSTGGTSWYTWHRSLTAGNLVYLNTTAAQTADTSISVSGTTLTLSSALANGTYIIYAWAHDTSANGLIQCGSYATDGSGNASVTLGWEPQYLLMKTISEAALNWYVSDVAIGGLSQTTHGYLIPNTSAAAASGSSTWLQATATGFKDNAFQGVGVKTNIYCAIRRGPMQYPGVGTQVYNALSYAGTGTNNRVITGVGFPPDAVLSMYRNVAGGNPHLDDRLRGAPYALITGGGSSTNGEASAPYNVSVFSMDGWTQGNSDSVGFNGTGYTLISWSLRRYPGVFDEVAYTGTGVARTVTHNLTVAPEMVITKVRAGSLDRWFVYHSALGSAYWLALNLTSAKDNTVGATIFGNDTIGVAPTSSVFSLGSYTGINETNSTYVAYLFASRANISKVGSYTGNGTNQNINANFSATARFILIKRTDVAGDWFVWDSTRGIIAGNDPHLSWNTTAAEVTTDDSIDPYTYGFTVNQDAATNINVTNATYIYLAFQ